MNNPSNEELEKLLEKWKKENKPSKIAGSFSNISDLLSFSYRRSDGIFIEFKK